MNLLLYFQVESKVINLWLKSDSIPSHVTRVVDIIYITLYIKVQLYINVLLKSNKTNLCFWRTSLLWSGVNTSLWWLMQANFRQYYWTLLSHFTNFFSSSLHIKKHIFYSPLATILLMSLGVSPVHFGSRLQSQGTPGLESRKLPTAEPQCFYEKTSALG